MSGSSDPDRALADLMPAFFDENQARAAGVSPTRMKALFFVLLGACTVAALRTVGACLVNAKVVTPARRSIC